MQQTGTLYTLNGVKVNACRLMRVDSIVGVEMLRMTRNFKKVCLIAMLLLQGCVFSAEVADYPADESGLDMDIVEFFTGEVRAWGVVQDYTGKVNRRVTGEFSGRRQGDAVVLTEILRFDDGEVTEREWTFARQEGGRYTATTPDTSLLSEASGQASGFAFHWQYRFLVPVDDDEIELDFDDWIFRIDDETAVNRIKLKKFGLTVGEMILFYRKQ